MNISVGEYLSILKLGIRKNNYILTWYYKWKNKSKIITKTIGLQIDE
jgi:hypothetical protein